MAVLHNRKDIFFRNAAAFSNWIAREQPGPGIWHHNSKMPQASLQGVASPESRQSWQTPECSLGLGSRPGGLSSPPFSHSPFLPWVHTSLVALTSIGNNQLTLLYQPLFP